jgi:hypothetical protein
VSDAVAERDVFANIVEGATATTLAVDLDYTIRAINRSATDAFRRIYGKEARVGDNLLELFADLPERLEKVRPIWGRALGGEDFVVTDRFGDETREQIAYEARFSALRYR